MNKGIKHVASEAVKTEADIPSRVASSMAAAAVTRIMFLKKEKE